MTLLFYLQSFHICFLEIRTSALSGFFKWSFFYFLSAFAILESIKHDALSAGNRS